MTISAAMVKELRERTGAGMMECKKALQEANGDMESAIELMRKSGQAKAAKKAGRIAAEGLIAMQANADLSSMVLVEINCETDFVAKNESFRSFATAVLNCALNGTANTLDELLASQIQPTTNTVQSTLENLIIELGENLKVRRFERLTVNKGQLFSYKHGAKIGVAVEVEGGDDNLGKDLAMHIAACNPLCITQQQVPAASVAKEREIFMAQASSESQAELEKLTQDSAPQGTIDKFLAKQPMVIEKKVEGRIRKFLNDVALSGQIFIKDDKLTVEQLLQQRGAKVLQFKRLEVGEGIEKKKEDFAAEVAAQAGRV